MFDRAPSAVCRYDCALVALELAWPSAPSRPWVSIAIDRPAGSSAADTMRLPLESCEIDCCSAVWLLVSALDAVSDPMLVIRLSDISFPLFSFRSEHLTMRFGFTGRVAGF